MSEVPIFNVGDLVETEDLNQGKKLSMIGKGGSVYIDSATDPNISPISIFCESQVTNLGNITSFIANNNLNEYVGSLTSYIAANQPARESDYLYFARMLWTLWKNPQNKVTTSSWDLMHAKVMAQEESIAILHEGINKIGKICA